VTDVDGETRIYAVVADPIFQLRTPEFLNPILTRLGANILAIPVHVSSADLPKAWSGFRRMRNLAGIGIAMPHKAAAAALCDQLDSTAAMLQVVSAVRRQPDGSFMGAALDGVGFVDGLRRSGHVLEGRRVLMIGAGGAATANSFALALAGIQSLTIANRDATKAESLARKLNEHCGRTLARPGGTDTQTCDVIVNATSLGLKPNDALPIEPTLLDPRHLVVDLVARPSMTRLLQVAQARGCAIHTGVHTIQSHMEQVARFICTASS
jgi:shikimate dehydrogenase